MLTEADGMSLANLCQTWSTLVKAQEKLTEMGVLYKAPSGYVMQSPLLAVVNQCVDTITKLSREFGLTPAARSRIFVQTEPEPEDELMTLLSMPRLDRTQPGDRSTLSPSISWICRRAATTMWMREPAIPCCWCMATPPGRSTGANSFRPGGVSDV